MHKGRATGAPFALCYNAVMKKFMVSSWLYDKKQREIFFIKFNGRVGAKATQFEKLGEDEQSITGEVIVDTEKAVKIRTKALTTKGDERLAEIWMPKKHIRQTLDVL